MDEREDVAHRASQTNDPFVPIFLLQEHLGEKFSSISIDPDMILRKTRTLFAADMTDQASDAIG